MMPDNLNIHSCPAVCEVGAHPTAEATIEAAELLALELQMQLPPLLNDLGFPLLCIIALCDDGKSTENTFGDMLDVSATQLRD